MDARIVVISLVIADGLRVSMRRAELCRSVNLSPSRLQHLFKSEMGQTLEQYRKDARMHEARLLLRTTLLSVKEIMHRVGVSSASHFAHDFREACGLSPTEYRSRAQQSTVACDPPLPANSGKQ